MQPEHFEPTERDAKDLGWPGDGWVPPVDLARFYKPLKVYREHYLGFVCPFCSCIFPPHMSHGVESFRNHIRAGNGCSFNPAKKGTAAAKAKASNF